MSPLKEKALDHKLALALRDNTEFRMWFLSKTKFAGRTAQCVLARSDYPWTTVTLESRNEETGELEYIRRQGETDVLVVFQDETGRRFALHIENKIHGGTFTQYQPEGYPERAKKWIGHEKYGNYTEWEAVLVAPLEFRNRVQDKLSFFGALISHEEIAEHIPAFGASAQEH